ncbi:hypothetical protein PV326_012528 [Microctonus aethiopoides]|nr:hypothetical protein PV326_012528 [Microctonus aethiopoides]
MEEEEDFRSKTGTKYIKEEERLWKVRSLSISMREKGIEWSKRKKEDESWEKCYVLKSTNKKCVNSLTLLFFCAFLRSGKLGKGERA